jgi:alcohol dehydrogenase class IV
MDGKYEFQVTTQIIYGRESARRVGEVANRFGLKKVQVITDAGLVQSGIAGNVVQLLKSSGVQTVLFDKVEYNPTVAATDAAKKQFAYEKCDGVVAVGGGSPMDAGKAVGILAANPGSAAEYLGIGKVKNPGVPVICLPTTSGTSAEITDVAVLSQPEKKAKLGLRSPYVAPAVAILDPLLTLSLPQAATRESGLDALAHAVESYVCLNAWTPTEALTLKGIELIGRHLRTATHNGSDYEARDGMMMGSLLAGMGLHATWVNLVHAITGPLGGFYNLPHGAANAIVLPHAMRFLLPGSVPKFANIARALGGKVEDLSERQAAEKAVEQVEELSRDVGMPRGLSVYGVMETDLANLSETIAGSFLLPLAPRVATAKDILEICRNSL